MWVDIVPSSCQEDEVFNIEPKPFDQFEVRVCVFDGQGIKSTDDDGSSDTFFRLFFN